MTRITLGEYVRRLRRAKRWGLQELADATRLSVSHLSRIENDNAIPNADTVVKLATALDGDLELMLRLADCLPREILERLVRHAGDEAPLRRAAGPEARDPTYPHALVEHIDPALRQALARQFGLSDLDVEGLFTMLQRVAQMTPANREAVIAIVASVAGEGER